MSWTKEFLKKVNGPWHKPAMQIFMAIVLAHWAEHLVQAYQVYVLDLPRPHSHGLLGHVFPWLNTSEWLHFGYAIVMVCGLGLLLPGFGGTSRLWWTTAFVIQIWHFIEHSLLLGQALLQKNLLGFPVRTSILQVIVPRVELHLFYNVIVFIPMVVAMCIHVFSSRDNERVCSCQRVHRVTNVLAARP